LDGGTVLATPATSAATPTLDNYLRESTLLTSGDSDQSALLDTLPSTGFTKVTSDQIMMAVIAESLVAAARITADRALLVSILEALERARNLVVGPGGLPERRDPAVSAPIADGLTLMLRLAIGFGNEGIPGVSEARALADAAIKGLTGLLNMPLAEFVSLTSSLTCRTDQPQNVPDDPDGSLLDAIWDKPDAEDSAHPVWEDTTPADLADPVQRSLASPATLRQASVGAVPPLLIGLLGILNVARLERLLRFSVPFQLRNKLSTYQDSKANLPGESGIDGKLVETEIRLLYEQKLSLGENTVLYGKRIGLGTVTLGDLRGTDPLWGAISDGLLSFFAGRPGEPDILDTARGHVYEIKPMRRAVDAGKQLCRYLFRLNFYELAIANPSFGPMEIAAWAARAAGGNTDPSFFLKGRTFNPPKRFWAPGPWVPPPTIPFSDGKSVRIATIEVPAPGIICYTTSPPKTEPKTVPDTAQSPDLTATMRLLVAMLIAWAGFEAGRRSRGLKEEDYARLFELSDFLSQSPAPPPPSFAELALKGAGILLLIVAGVAVVALVGSEVAAVLGSRALLELFLERGSVALEEAATLPAPVPVP
jgi:hypothetical protein